MEIQNPYFGTVTYERHELIHFVEGIIGFAECRDYLPLSFEADSDQMLLLQSTEEPSISFILMNPFHLKGDYQPAVSKEMQKLLKCQEDEHLSFYVIAVIREPFTESTVNLKCPIVVNPKNRLAMQIILEDSDYSLRHPLNSFTGKEEPTC